MTRTDLHVHSRYSNDGELAIEEIVNRSLAKGISVLSVTDHNIVGGTTEALKLCRNSNINFIPGIEIDCQYKGTDMHLLGYQIDWKNGEILALETIAEKKMMDAVPLMIQSLALAGIEIDGDELMEKLDNQKRAGMREIEGVTVGIATGFKKCDSALKFLEELTGKSVIASECFGKKWKGVIAILE